MTILFFGDSITWGAWDEEGGWVARIKKHVDAKTIASSFDYYQDIYNLGISGDKTDDILERFEGETKSRIDEEQESAIVFAIGVNDSQHIDNQGHRVPINQFENNLKSLIEKARKFSNKIVFVGLFPVDDSKLDPTPWDDNKCYKNEYVEKYNEIIKKGCNSCQVDFIDLYGKFIDKHYKDLLLDGLHPNTEGHKQIAEVVLEVLQGKNIV